MSDDGIIDLATLNSTFGEIIESLWRVRRELYRELSKDLPLGYFHLGAMLGMEVVMRSIIITSMGASGRKSAHRSEILHLLNETDPGTHAATDPADILRALSMALLAAGLRPVLPAAPDGVVAVRPAEPEIRDELGNVMWREEGHPPPDRKLN